MATPKPANFTFIGQSGITYNVDAYVSDVNAALVNLDGGAGAGTGSPTYWIAPENCTLVDFSMVTGTADTEKLRVLVNSKPLTNVIRYDTNLTTLAKRQPVNIGFAKGSQISFIQISD